MRVKSYFEGGCLSYYSIIYYDAYYVDIEACGGGTQGNVPAHPDRLMDRIPLYIMTHIDMLISHVYTNESAPGWLSGSGIRRMGGLRLRFGALAEVKGRQLGENCLLSPKTCVWDAKRQVTIVFPAFFHGAAVAKAVILYKCTGMR